MSYTKTTTRQKLRTAAMATVMLIGIMSAADAHAYQRNSSETRPTATTETTRTSRAGTLGDELPSEGEWMFFNEQDMDYLAAMRMDMDSTVIAEMAVDMVSDPAALEQEFGFTYEGSFRVRGLGYCQGTKVTDPEITGTIYIVTCADGRYVNLVMGSDKKDVIEAAEQMSDGYIPDLDDYEEQ